MGNHGVLVSEDMSAEELFDIAQKNNLLSDEELEDFELRIKGLQQDPFYLSGIHPEEYKDNSVKKDLYHKLSNSSRVFDVSHIHDALHPVTLTHGFWTLDCEVTQKMWLSVMPESSANVQIKLLGESDNMPVRMVSWTDAQEFCQTLSKKLRADVHLPTDAQWEYACRANAEETPELIKSQTNSSETQLRKPIPAQSLSPNAWGLYNMPGNVEEWVADWYEPINDSQPQIDPIGPDKSTPYKSMPIKEAKVIRGGAFLEKSEIENFFSMRIYDNKDSRRLWTGFRICVSVE